MLYYERRLRKQGCKFIVGIDEAGRGPLAGPVVAAAVIFDAKCSIKSRVDDSKKLTPKQRDKAFLEITSKLPFGIGIVSEKIIDRVNILEATRLAMENAVLALFERNKNIKKHASAHLLIDGNVKLGIKSPFTNIIDGDQKSKSIACASILAKVSRDRIMDIYDKIYPEYGFLRHKGYPTFEHKKAIQKFGLSSIHRVSFAPCSLKMS